MNSDDKDNEVKFWLELIAKWEANYSEPAPKRMLEALELAKSKHELLEAQHISRHQQNH